MNEVQRFEEKVRQALKDVMAHAVGGHETGSGPEAGFQTFCNDPAHALHILSDAGIRPVNEAVAHFAFDKAP